MTEYGYTDTVWKDRLTSFDGTAITYDQIGNPLNWTNGATLTWQHGRQLSGYTLGDTAITYVYNQDGIRTSKTVNGTTTQYTVTDGTLRRLSDGTNTLEFINGTSVLFNGVEYWYVFNAQNDVIGIIDENGEYVVEYTYDAWGAPLSKTGSLADTLGTLNPFRYRGYIYDEETGWYYCQSRYYDLNVGRWLNADSVVPNVGGNIRGYNQFAYCFNNPINRVDTSGNWPTWEEFCEGWNDFWNGVGSWLGNVWDSAGAILGGVQADVSVGVGIGGSIDIGTEASLSLVAKADIERITCDLDEGFDFGKEIAFEGELSVLIFDFSLGKRGFYHSDLCPAYSEGNHDIATCPYSLQYPTDEIQPIPIIDVEAYLGLGFSAGLSYDTEGVGERLIEIWSE